MRWPGIRADHQVCCIDDGQQLLESGFAYQAGHRISAAGQDLLLIMFFNIRWRAGKQNLCVVSILQVADQLYIFGHTPVAKIPGALTGAGADDAGRASACSSLKRKLPVSIGHRDVPAHLSVTDAEVLSKLKQPIQDMAAVRMTLCYLLVVKGPLEIPGPGPVETNSARYGDGGADHIGTHGGIHVEQHRKLSAFQLVPYFFP
jgi:hypothetical protein